MFPISSLCAVMGNSSSLGCHKHSLPIFACKARLNTLTLPLPGKSPLFHSAGRNQKSHLTQIWNNQGCISSRARGLGCVGTRVCIQLWSPFILCCPLISAPMGPAPLLECSTTAFLSVSLALWRLGREISRKLLATLYKCNLFELTLTTFRPWIWWPNSVARWVASYNTLGENIVHTSVKNENTSPECFCLSYICSPKKQHAQVFLHALFVWRMCITRQFSWKVGVNSYSLQVGRSSPPSLSQDLPSPPIHPFAFSSMPGM